MGFSHQPPPTGLTMNQEELNTTRLFVLQRAIGALIVTHPEPERFAKTFGSSIGLQQLDQIAYPLSKPDVRAESKAFAQELLELANDEVLQRAQGKKPPSA
ncbi:MAG: hypothetical protein CO065_01100 [Comamonadaceae bacterium CG_4_9_14_0_8_um_filter_57_21]|nr:MAG: hypothetical protein CO065_01100 [Comamonadaceae bacterium CG_4_9_14_0_8_um_filter_57_21]